MDLFLTLHRLTISKFGSLLTKSSEIMLKVDERHAATLRAFIILGWMILGASKWVTKGLPKI